MKRLISVRLEGGIGDHILGMRLLYFIKKRYPRHKIIAYSDCAGHPAPQEVARMSPFLSEVIAVYQKRKLSQVSTWGSLNNIRRQDAKRMFGADLFFDAWSAKFFIEASQALGMPFYEVLNHRAELVIPRQAQTMAAEFLRPHKGKIFVGLNIAKYGFNYLKRNQKTVLRFLELLLKDPRVVILNFYTSDYKFPHWPIPLSIDREKNAARESIKTGKLWDAYSRVIPAVDLPISLVTALIKRCAYFIGVDNGVKHLAWALGVEHTVFVPEEFSNRSFILRWMPDYHRHLLFNCLEKDFSRHLKEARAAVFFAKKNKV